MLPNEDLRGRGPFWADDFGDEDVFWGYVVADFKLGVLNRNIRGCVCVQDIQFYGCV